MARCDLCGSPAPVLYYVTMRYRIGPYGEEGKHLCRNCLRAAWETYRRLQEEEEEGRSA